MVSTPRFLPAARRLVSALLALALAGCAIHRPGALPEPVAEPSQAAAQGDPVSACQRWYRQLDEGIDARGVRDGGARRLPDWPFLRVDRLLASYRDEALQSDAAWQAWGERLLALDAQARAHEIDNLPPSDRATLAVPDAQTAKARVGECGALLWRQVSDRARLREQATVPDDYSTAKRAIGLYALSRWPFFGGVERELRHWQARWNRAAETLPDGSGWVRYQPTLQALSEAEITALMESIPRDVLGLARPSPAQAERLFQAHAPTLVVQTRGDFDRPGALAWGASPAPLVKPAEPVIYRRLAHTRVGGQSLLQLVYTVWFSERPAISALDLLAGRVDGLVLRLTLADDGSVLMLDSIHPCGCYHVFVPAPSVALRPAPQPSEEWAFVPARLPSTSPGQRLALRVASGDHQLLGVAPAGAGSPDEPFVPYALVDDNNLRSLPQPQGGRRSAFGPRGIMPGTERGERLLFWPMGIESPGAMRQWGRQPTAFVGRRHFDDPWLLDQRFGFDQGGAHR